MGIRGIISYITAQSLEEVKYLREQYDDSFWGSQYTAVRGEKEEEEGEEEGDRAIDS